MTELGPSPLAAGDELPVDAARAAIAAALRPITGTEPVPLAAGAGPRAGGRRDVADRRAGARQLGDGRLRLRGADLRADEPTVLQAAAGTVFAGAPFAGARAPRGELHPHHDRRGDAGRAGHRGAASSCAASTARTVTHRSPACCAPARTGASAARTWRAAASRCRPGACCGRPTSAWSASLGLDRVTVVPARCAWRCSRPATRCVTPGPAAGARAASTTATASACSARLQRLGIEVLDLGLVPTTRRALQATVDRAHRRGRCRAHQRRRQHGRRRLHARPAGRAWARWRSGRWRCGPAGRSPSARCSAPAAGTAWLFALPGNPVAALVTFYAFARDAPAARWPARAPSRCRVLQARSAAAIRKRPGRTEFQRAIVEPRRRRRAGRCAPPARRAPASCAA